MNGGDEEGAKSLNKTGIILLYVGTAVLSVCKIIVFTVIIYNINV